MVYGCGNKCVKFTVFAINFLVFVVGAVVLGVSLAVRFSGDVRRYVQDLVEKSGADINVETMYIPLYILAAIGGFLLLTGFLGCCGAGFENTCLLGVFFTIILILFIAELACGIAIIVKKEWFKAEIINKGIKAAIDKYKNAPAGQEKEDLKNALKNFQAEFKCCGCDSFADYLPSAPPDNCLETLRGCCPAVWDELSSKLTTVGIVALVVLVIELLAMVFTCILCQAFKRGDYQYA